jgi:transposase
MAQEIMDYIKGTDREQIFLFKETLDNSIKKENYVRIIDSYVESLDLESLGFEMPTLKHGKPPYRPHLLLKIYFYGYMEKIRSSRKLEKECARNIEMMWLTQTLAPDFKTISDFRKRNKKGIRNIFKEFLTFCNKAGLLSLETVAIDGTKLRGQNNLNNVYHRNGMEKIQKKIASKIEEYLKELDKEDLKESESINLENIDKNKNVLEKLEKLKKYQNKVEDIQKEFEKDEDVDLIFATDKDCRFQSDKGKVRAGYNAQTAVDSTNKLIVVSEVTAECNDQNQTTVMICELKEIKKELGIENKTEVLEDAGYFNEKEIVSHRDEESVELFIPDSKDSNKFKKENLGKIPKKEYEIDKFKYEKEQDIFICPMGKGLKRISINPIKENSGREVLEYHCESCKECSEEKNCTNNKRGRSIKVSANKEYMDNFKSKMKKEESIKKIEKRKELSEHPFGCIKYNLGYTYFLQKGIEKVRSEFSFICFTHNFKRAINILGFAKFMELLKT